MTKIDTPYHESRIRSYDGVTEVSIDGERWRPIDAHSALRRMELQAEKDPPLRIQIRTAIKNLLKKFI